MLDIMYNYYMYIIRLIASQPILRNLLILWNGIAVIGIGILQYRLDQSIAPNTIIIPDMRMTGYTYSQLYNDFYDIIDTKGCDIYYTLATWDIYILSPAYTLFLATIWVYISRYTYDRIQYMNQRNGYWYADQKAIMVVPILLLDWIETFIQRHGCSLLMQQNAEQLSTLQVHIASTAVTLKWIFIAFILLSILERLYRVFVGGANRVGARNIQLPLWM